MAGVVQNANSEFWRAPAPDVAVAAPTLTEACKHCSSEFVVGAGFCHVCGAERTKAAPAIAPVWNRYVDFARQLEFHRIKERIGLPTAAMIAFLAGVTCVLAAILVGLIFSANTVLDWQAVQIWRIEWLLGAAAAFLSGILLKKS